MNKKTITLIAGFALIAAIVPACNRGKSGTATSPQAATAQASTATATPETDFTFADGTITAYIGTDTTVLIPSRIQGQAVTAIGESAFSNKQLTGVVIPNSVITIGYAAFYNNQLTSVVIPDSVTVILGSAFSENQLTNVAIPDRVTTILAGTFYNNKLVSITIPNSVTTIGDEAFRMNPLTSIVIGANVLIGGGDSPSDAGPYQVFNNNFNKAYHANGKQAGTYTLNNGVWSLDGSGTSVDNSFSKIMYVTSKEGLTQREEPSTNGRRIGSFIFGQRIGVYEQGLMATIDGISSYWYKSSTEKEEDCWVFGGYLSEEFPEEAPIVLGFWENAKYQSNIYRFNPGGEYRSGHRESGGGPYGFWKLNGDILTLTTLNDGYELRESPKIDEITVSIINKNSIVLKYSDGEETQLIRY